MVTPLLAHRVPASSRGAAGGRWVCGGVTGELPTGPACREQRHGAAALPVTGSSLLRYSNFKRWFHYLRLKPFVASHPVSQDMICAQCSSSSYDKASAGSFGGKSRTTRGTFLAKASKSCLLIDVWVAP